MRNYTDEELQAEFSKMADWAQCTILFKINPPKSEGESIDLSEYLLRIKANQDLHFCEPACVSCKHKDILRYEEWMATCGRCVHSPARKDCYEKKDL